MKKEDFLHAAFNADEGILRTHHKLCGFYKQHFRYVAPVEVFLGRNAKNVKCTYHYIPIKETLHAHFENSSKFINKLLFIWL